MHAPTFTAFYLLHERIWLDEAVLQALAETANPGYHRLDDIGGLIERPGNHTLSGDRLIRPDTRPGAALSCLLRMVAAVLPGRSTRFTESIATMNRIEALSPLDGCHLGYFVPPEPETLSSLMASLRLAGEAWAARPVAARVAVVGQMRQVIMANLDDTLSILCRTTGKVPTEALLSEIYPVLEQLRYYEAEAVRILARQPVETSPLAYPGAQAYVEQRPFGVVAVITPWNYPFQLTMIAALSALLAGNAVVIKPSELALPVGDWMAALFSQIAELAALVAVVPGDGTTGRQLIETGPDLIFFTGNGQTGRRVMQAASARLIPLIMELGGKDAMIVLADAPFERSVRAAVYGAFTNSGQACISVERALVARPLYARFVSAVVEATARLRVGADAGCDLGAMTAPRQIAIVEAQYQDAIARGAKASGPFRREGGFVHPVVLWDVTPDMQVWQAETFGPLLPVMAFDHPDEAIAWANLGELGLNGSVWTQDVEQGQAVGRRLRAGGYGVNEVIKQVGHPGLPFGGVGQSGFGRYRGAEGLRAFSQSVAVMVNSGQQEQEPNWFPYSEEGYRHLRGFVDCMHGEGHWLRRLGRNWQAMQSFQQYMTLPGFKARHKKQN
jgi:acyl-CoA reductase-like NAD-dependent aldehyde dehydrogenase